MIAPLVKKVWESPSFMSWLNKVSSLIKILVLLPLILVNFNQFEIASWLVFTSIIFFSGLLNEQGSLVVSRMIAAAYGGAADLDVISVNRKPEILGSANWDLIKKLFGSLGVVNLSLSTIGLVLSLIIGYLTIDPLLSDYEEANSIWLCLAIFVITQFVSQSFMRYVSMTRGCDMVALNSRTETFFILLSAIFGVIVLLLGYRIVPFTIVTQGTLLLKIPCQYYLMNLYIVPKDVSLTAWAYDKKILQLIFKPLWKSLFRGFSMSGVSKIATILLARNLEVVYLTKFLLSLRILDMIEQFSIVPLTSNVPRFAKKLACNDTNALKGKLVSAFQVSTYLSTAGILFITYFWEVILGIIGSNAEMINSNEFSILALGFLICSFIRRSFIITVLGNNIIAVKHLLVSSVVSCILLVYLIPSNPFYGYIIGVFLPIIIILNLYPLKEGCILIECSVIEFIKKVLLLPISVLFVSAAYQFLNSKYLF